MKTPREIFETVGVPIVKRSSAGYAGFRGFNEHDIAAIIAQAQREILEDVKPLLEGLKPLPVSTPVPDWIFRINTANAFLAKYATLLSDSEKEGE